MVQEQPVSTSHVEQHPLSERLNNSLRKPIPGHSVKTGAQDKVPDSAQEPPMDGSPSTQPWASTTSGSHQSVSCLLPEGHYHIVLNELLDAIPLISYLALRSTRTVCYLDAESPWNSYVVLVSPDYLSYLIHYTYVISTDVGISLVESGHWHRNNVLRGDIRR